MPPKRNRKNFRNKSEMNANADITKSETDQDFDEICSTSTKKVTWSVRNLTSLPEHVDYRTDSPRFVFRNASWCLRLYPNGKNSRNVNCIGLTIVRLSSRIPRHTLEYSFLSEGCFGNIHSKVAHFDEDNTAGEMEFTSRHLPYSFSPDRGESIEVTCVVTCYESHALDEFSETDFSVQDARDVGAKFHDCRCHDFKNMLLNGQNHDVTLKVKDKEFRAHQDVLRSRSSVFQSMLSHDMIEKNSGAIDITDCDPSAFEQFLVYLYSGGVETLDTGNMLSVYYVADKYDTGRLKDECRKFIKKSLSASNITDVVQFAVDHSDAVLLRWAIDYIVRAIDEILLTVEWLSFLKRNPVQANELIIKVRKHTTD